MKPPRLIRDRSGRYKLKISLPGGRYQLSLDDQAVIVLTDQLGLSVDDTVPAPFVPFFVAMDDAWFPNQRDIDGIVQQFQSNWNLTSAEESILKSYLTETPIKSRNEKRVWKVIKESPLADEIEQSDLQIQDLPPISDPLNSPHTDDSPDSGSSVSKPTDGGEQTTESEAVAASTSSEPQDTLTAVPGIGDNYASALRKEGFQTISDVADTPAAEIDEKTTVPLEAAQCIQVGAKETRGDKITAIAAIAEETDTDRTTVADAYATIAGHVGGISDKTAALRELFSSTSSIFDLDDQSLYYLYSLYTSGYQNIPSVADASLDELTDVPYITHQAEEIRTAAQAHVRDTDSQHTTAQDQGNTSASADDDSVDGPPYVCPKCGDEYKYERVMEKHQYSCDGKSSTTSGSSDNNSTATDEPPYICPKCGDEYKYERVMQKHRYSCDGESAVETGSEAGWDPEATHRGHQSTSSTSVKPNQADTPIEFVRPDLSALTTEDGDSNRIVAKLARLRDSIDELFQEHEVLDGFRWGGSPGSPYLGPPNPHDSTYVWLGLAHECYESNGKPTKGLQFEFGFDGGSNRGFFGREVICGLYFGPWADDSVVTDVKSTLRSNTTELARFLSDHTEYILITKGETWQNPTPGELSAAIDDLGDGFTLTLDCSIDESCSWEDVRRKVCRSFVSVLSLYITIAGLSAETVLDEDTLSDVQKTLGLAKSTESDSESDPTVSDTRQTSEESVGSDSNTSTDEMHADGSDSRFSDPEDEAASENIEKDATAERNEELIIKEEDINDAFPDEMVSRDQWLLWKETDDGRKIPRAPWETGDPLRYVNAMDPANWTSFTEAVRWSSKLPFDVQLAYALTRDDPVVFIDLDDVIIDDELSPDARSLIEDANSYTARSTSGTGAHIFVRGSLPEGTKSLTGPLDHAGDQTVEVYDRNRFVAMTGDHLDWTPTQLQSSADLLSRLEEEFATVSSSTPDRATVEPQRSRDELRDIETTSDIQDVFDAINQTLPSDIRMLSTKTKEHGDGTYSYDPSWVHSESGTRLGVLDDIWIYRKGMIALNALQVVALEEGIITDERAYPEGEAFWDAVEALRDRGAHIPKFEPSSSSVADIDTEETDGQIDKWEVATRINYGDTVRTHIRPRDRDYQEKLAVDLAPVFVDAAQSLHLSPPVTYRAAELYAKAHAAGIVPGAAHECTVGAALRVASLEAGTPRPLADIAETVGEDANSIRRKFNRIMRETDVSDVIDASDLIVDPSEYVPYMARQLGRDSDETLCEDVRKLLSKVNLDGASNPMSEVSAAFYVVMKEADEYSITQQEISDAAGLSKVTIRDNYKKYTQHW